MSKHKKVQISEHALMRYFERYVGLDVKKFKLAIRKDIGRFITKGKGKFETPYGVAIVRNWTVVTFITKEQDELNNMNVRISN